jgi:5,10-methylenetetrahydrofolate reductase
MDANLSRTLVDFIRHCVPTVTPLRRSSGLQDQLKHAEAAAFPQLNRRLSSAMKRDALSWNRRQRPNAFLRITMSVSDVPQHFDFPEAVAEALKPHYLSAVSVPLRTARRRPILSGDDPSTSVSDGCTSE